MTALLARRTHRFGKDRVYVSRGDGARVACLDLVACTLDVADDELDEQVRSVLESAGYGEATTRALVHREVERLAARVRVERVHA
jgi:hypothetical protein